MTWVLAHATLDLQAVHALDLRSGFPLVISFLIPGLPQVSGWMPKPFRRKPAAHGSSSLLRYLFPHTTQRARARLSEFRHETFPSLKRRTQSRIYKYIVYRQARKLGKLGILQRLRGHTRTLLGSNYLEHEARLRRQKLTKIATSGEESQVREMNYQDNYAPREPGARRRKLAGYLKAANELRQTYQQQYAPGWSRSEASYEYEDDTPGAFPDAAIVRSGEEEMILFPSYARKHVKRKVSEIRWLYEIVLTPVA